MIQNADQKPRTCKSWRIEVRRTKIGKRMTNWMNFLIVSCFSNISCSRSIIFQFRLSLSSGPKSKLLSHLRTQLIANYITLQLNFLANISFIGEIFISIFSLFLSVFSWGYFLSSASQLNAISSYLNEHKKIIVSWDNFS